MPIGRLVSQITARVADVSRQVRFRIDPDLAEAPAHTDVPVHAVVDFKGMIGAHLQALTVEAAVAERLESLYWRGIRAVRFEDIVDLYYLVRSTAIDVAQVAKAIGLVFENRGLRPPSSVPDSLQPEFTLTADTARRWKHFLRREHLDDPKVKRKPEQAAPASEMDSLEVVARFLREAIARWLFEIATRDQVIATAAPASASHPESSHPSAQTLYEKLFFPKRRQ